MDSNEIPQLKMNGEKIKRVLEFNFLGLTIDESLTWKNHINKISAKISRINGIMNQLKHSLPTRILKLMYESFVLSHISYCITAWGYNLDKIAKLQNKSLRIICKAKYNAHADPLLS